jgi:hypothetical protein
MFASNIELEYIIPNRNKIELRCIKIIIYMEVLGMVKYLKFSWKDQNNASRKKSLIGISFNEDTGYLKIRWLGGSALPATSSVISLLKWIVENDLGRLKEKYLPRCFQRIKVRNGSSNCIDLNVINFPYKDEFDDFGYIAGKIHVSMYKRLNETIIYEGNVWNLIKLLERILFMLKEDKESEDITNLEVKEFTPWGESLRKKHNYEYEKF